MNITKAEEQGDIMNYLQGLICGLESNSCDKGVITIVDTKQQKCRISLNSTDYAKAIEAHIKGLSVQITVVDAESKPPIGKDLEVYPINAGSFIIDKHLEKLSNEMPALVFESQEKGYGVRIVLHGVVIPGLISFSHTNYIVVSLYKNRRYKEPSVYMFREIPDPEELIKLGVQAQDAYLNSKSYKDIVQQYKDIVKPQQTVERQKGSRMNQLSDMIPVQISGYIEYARLIEDSDNAYIVIGVLPDGSIALQEISLPPLEKGLAYKIYDLFNQYSVEIDLTVLEEVWEPGQVCEFTIFYMDRAENKLLQKITVAYKNRYGKLSEMVKPTVCLFGDDGEIYVYGIEEGLDIALKVVSNLNNPELLKRKDRNYG